MPQPQKDARPRHMQVTADLRRRIAEGEFAVGAKMPSLRALTADYEISEVTAHTAIRALQQEGLVESTSGRGTFVTATPTERTDQDSLNQRLERLQSEVVELARRVEVLEAAAGAVTTSRAKADGYRPEAAGKPEPQPVVAAIVTSKHGVLIGRRNDGTPPWTLIAGEIEPGESPSDAAVREVKEETGLQVHADEREIGRRVHPATGRTMIYLACRPTGRTDIFVGDKDELAEVRWAGLTDAEALLPGLYEPVRAFLAREIG